MSVTRNASTLLACALLSASAAWGAGYMYRYVNDEGVVVIGYSVPPQFVHRGYKELNPDGTLHRVVKPSLSDEEKANRSEELQAIALAEKEAERLRKYDQSLMLRYSSIEDIEAARDRALSELKIRVSILRSNVRSLKSQVENNQAHAADIERSGGEVPVDIVSVIDGLRDEIVEAERAIADRSREMDVVSDGYQGDIERFALLLDKVQFRNQRSASQD